MIKFIWNLLALLGLALVALLITAVVKYPAEVQTLTGFDQQAPATYLEMVQKLAQTGNGAEATVWKVPVAEGLTTDDVEETMKFVANEHNFKNVGEMPLYKEIEAISGKTYRFIKIYLFCDAFSAYLPCRITLLEDGEGKLWLYTLNMDLMIHGGTPLPDELREEAMQVKEIILDIMNRGANGEF